MRILGIIAAAVGAIIYTYNNAVASDAVKTAEVMKTTTRTLNILSEAAFFSLNVANLLQGFKTRTRKAAGSSSAGDYNTAVYMGKVTAAGIGSSYMTTAEAKDIDEFLN